MSEAKAIAAVEEIIADLRGGKMVVLVDDEARENEGDLLLAAQFANADAVNFMAREARGLICLTLPRAHCEKLRLAPMAARGENDNGFERTNFVASIEAARGVTTGISAADRARTILAAAHADARPEDLKTPGHIFPVMARDGGVLVRAGHTEAGCDLARLAGLFPAAVICEIMNDDGKMARLPDLRIFAERHGLKIGAIESLIGHRLQTEHLVRQTGEFETATAWGDFRVVIFADNAGGRTHLAFCRGRFDPARPTLARVIAHPTALDAVGMRGLGRHWDIAAALQKIARAGEGVLLVVEADLQTDINAQLRTAMRRGGEKTEKSESASPAGRWRTFGIGAQILRLLGIGKIALMASARMRFPSLSGFGLEVTEIVAKDDSAGDG